MKSPKWKREEIILALDLYYDLKSNEISSKNEKIIELSIILNKLPIYLDKRDNKKYRNSNSVALKLNNFKAIDPEYYGKGMTSYSRLDKEIFFEFINRRDDLKSKANYIKKL